MVAVGPLWVGGSSAAMAGDDRPIDTPSHSSVRLRSLPTSRWSAGEPRVIGSWEQNVIPRIDSRMNDRSRLRCGTFNKHSHTH